MEEPIRLLPHHLESVFLSRVWKINVLQHRPAYDAPMQERFGEILSSLTDESTHPVQLVREPDSLCARCPYNPEAPNYNSPLDDSECKFFSKTNNSRSDPDVNRLRDVDDYWADVLGVEDLVGGRAVPAGELVRRIREYDQSNDLEIMRETGVFE